LITSIDDDDVPINGDRVMCFKCGKFGIFEPDAQGRVRKPTKTELKSISSDPDCRKMMMRWAMFSG
jgi:hypothetical protein